MEAKVSEFAQKVNLSIFEYVDELQAHPANSDKQPVSFLSGDPTAYGQTQFQMPKEAYDIVRKHIAKPQQHGYSNSVGVPQFRDEILKLYKPKFQLKTADIHINHGANMSLLGCLMALTNEGDEVLVPELGYPFFHNVCPALKRKAVPYKLKKQDNFNIDLEHAASLITDKTAFMFVINPANPTGAVFSKKHMEEILAFSDKHEIPLVCDEVYYGMVYPGVETYSFGELTEDVPVIVISGVQKIFSVPGWVQSWTIVFDKHGILGQIKNNLEVLGTVFLHTNTFSQFALVDIIREFGIFTHKQMLAIQKNYEYLRQRVNKYPFLKSLSAQGTIYLAVEVDFSHFKDIATDRELAKALRKEQNVNLLPLSSLGSGVQGVRLLTFAGEELYNSLFQRLDEFVGAHKKE